MFRNIMVAVDGSSTSRRGLKIAVDLAADQQAALHIVHIVDEAVVIPLDAVYVPANTIDSMVEGLRDSGRDILAKAVAVASERGLQPRTALVDSGGSGVAAKLLREATKRKADLIVLGTHGRRGLRRLLLGSDAELVLREARVPVLLVRAPERGGATKAIGATKPTQAAGRRASPRGKSAARAPSGTA